MNELKTLNKHKLCIVGLKNLWKNRFWDYGIIGHGKWEQNLKFKYKPIIEWTKSMVEN